MRNAALWFLERTLERGPFPRPIYEFGSFLVPAQRTKADLRRFFPGRPYVGCDVRKGPGVDRVEDLHKLTLEDGSVGTALCFETLEHVRWPHRAIAELCRVLKPRGLLVVSTLFSFPVHGEPGEYGDYWRFTPEGLRLLLAEVGDPRIEHDDLDASQAGVYGWVVKER